MIPLTPPLRPPTFHNKQVSHPTVEQLTAIAANCFTPQDLLRMERVLLDALDFTVCTQTAFTFLHLFAQVRPRAADLSALKRLGATLPALFRRLMRSGGKLITGCLLRALLSRYQTCPSYDVISQGLDCLPAHVAALAVYLLVGVMCA
jgi:hypothetical protein